MHIQFKDKSLSFDRPRIMGILNVTPDSFSDGGLFFNRDDALKRAEQMVKEGADIIDIGAESTRPGASDISDEQQLERLCSIVESIHKNIDTVISIDTSSSNVIKECVRQGAHMWNDIRALQEKDAIQTAAMLDIPVCLMHMQGTPRSMQDNPTYTDVVSEVRLFLLQRANICIENGIKKENIILDPGFGFGKNAQDNYRLLSHLDELCSSGYIVLSALSRKSMLGYATGIKSANERVVSSVAGAVISVMKGAHMVRVHDVSQTREALDVALQVAINR